MSFIIPHQALTMSATMAAADTSNTAVATQEQSAALVSFQRLPPLLPPTQNDDSAPRSLTSACHFSGNDAIYAINAVTTASTATYKHKNGCQLKTGM